jgi:hypothetical protein
MIADEEMERLVFLPPFLKLHQRFDHLLKMILATELPDFA